MSIFLQNLILSFLLLFITSCAIGTGSSYSGNYVSTSGLPYSCNKVYSRESSYQLDTEMPYKPNCVNSIFSFNSVDEYNKCVDDFNLYVSQLGEWQACKSNYLTEFAKDWHSEVGDKVNEFIEKRNKDRAPTSLYNQLGRDTVSTLLYDCSLPVEYVSDYQYKQCVFKLPEVSDLENVLTYGSMEEIQNEYDHWLSNLATWVDNSSNADIKIAHNNIRKAREDLEYRIRITNINLGGF